jgi:DNA-binding transcriptional MerR regulator
MTSLSRKALRHYHDLGLLEPAHVDARTSYRFYDTSQVDHAHIIRRFRALGMSIPDVKTLLATNDAAVRNEIITSHLQQMEQQLQETKDTVTALRELLTPTPSNLPVTLRHEPAAPIWAITEVINIGDIDQWFSDTMHRLYEALEMSGTRPEGSPGGLYERELFTDARGRATLFVPAVHTNPAPHRINAQVLPDTEVAVLTHAGSHQGIDRSYGALGTYVHEHLISREGPIREHYRGAPPSNPTAFTHTEICWPIFSTAPPAQ